MRRFSAPFITLALVVALAACGGGDDDSDGASDTTTADGSGDDTTLPTTGDEGIDEMLERARESTYKVTYETDDGDQIVVAQDPPRYAFIQGDSGTYQLEDGSAVTCSGLDDPDTAECTTLPIGGDFLTQTLTTVFGGGFAAIAIAAGEGNDFFGTVELSDDEIAGRDAKCATFDPGSAPFVPETGSWEVCVDEETGAMLRSSGTDAEGNETEVFEAVEFGEPTDADLDPPTEPVEITIPSLPGGITVPTLPND